MGNLSDHRVQGIYQLQVVRAIPSLCLGVQSEMSETCALCIFDAAFALIGNQD